MNPKPCPDCNNDTPPVSRRDFLKAVGVGAAAAAAGAVPLFATPKLHAAPPTPNSGAETAAKALYETLSDVQKKEVCFDWNYETKERGLLRTFVSNNWQITKPHIRSEFYNEKQLKLAHEVFAQLVNPKWYNRMLQHLKDDTGGKEWGADQSMAFFGKPGDDKFEFVMTGRHMTLRADGNTESHVAFGGPIFYGHQATQVKGLIEEDGHPDNVFWSQAIRANNLFKKLDKEQQKKALLPTTPRETAVEFHGKDGNLPGLPTKEMSSEQKKMLEKVLASLMEPFRSEDQEEAMDCLKKLGGLEACSLAFYSDEDLGSDGVWDNWRLEGPAFVWYFRGNPHVHVWVNVADDPSVKLNA
jgi:hypothetical protein